MYAWEQIQQTLDYLEGHLTEEVDIESLAKLANLSPFYFQRLFSRLVKKPVAEYVKLRRIAKAAEALRDREKRILDVALELVCVERYPAHNPETASMEVWTKLKRA